MSRVSRKEDLFFQKFREFSARMVDAGELFDGLFNTYPQGAGAKIARIKEIEVQCDDLVRDIMTTLYQSFITPFDREDITEITGELDEIVDGLEGVSARLGLYDIDRVRPEAIELSRLTLRAIRRLNDAFDNFSNYKRDPSVVEALIETADIEDRGDKVYRGALGNVFREKGDPIETVKWKSLLDKMEDTLDACKAVASAVLAVIVKNA